VTSTHAKFESARQILDHTMAWLKPRRDATAAAELSAYLKIGERADRSPPMGVRKDVLKELYRELKARFRPSDEGELLAQMEALWQPPWREPKYAAIEHARAFENKLLGPAALPLLERTIRSGAWWDLVDGLAAWLVGSIYLRHRKPIRSTLDRWRTDDDLWLRRSVLLAHLKHKDETDARALFADVEALMHEKEFFIRKAIGWVLRDYSYAAPDAVKAFLVAHRNELSGLSFREGAKQLVKMGKMKGGADGLERRAVPQPRSRR